MNENIFKRSAALAAVFVLILASGTANCFSQPRAVSLNKSTNRAPYSDGIVVGNTLYVAGLQGSDPNGKFPPGGFAPQARAVLQNIERVVTQAGFRMKDVVSVNVYLTDIHDFAAMNGIYKAFFPDPKPTRTTVQVAALSKGALIEISAIAVRSGRAH